MGERRQGCGSEEVIRSIAYLLPLAKREKEQKQRSQTLTPSYS